MKKPEFIKVFRMEKNVKGAALASVPIIIVFLIFQKYFTKGITMGAVKG